MSARFAKVVASLPDPLDADTLYAVRTGSGFDLYISDNTGATAHALNLTAGADGADGASAYDVAVAEGFVGDEAAWLASLVGADGDDGADGAQGPQGIQGPAGADGADGTNVTVTVAANQTAFENATPGAIELVVLYSA